MKGSRNKQQNVPYKLTRNKIIVYSAIAAVVAVIGYFGWYAMIPVNGTTPVFGPRNNHFIKALHAGSGFHYVSISSGAVKGLRSTGGSTTDPEYVFTKNDIQSLHLINEDAETHSRHNINIDAFNVHSKDLAYYESQTIDFIPDKTGTFEYYCTIHPEMKGQITVEG
ncbi:MAG TPA: cupredoxin domain-containing protein [Nitrososphaera sp.]|jgi:hypothetical protein|nr:cupredoxin domain-containing protein [Nitrososphaera sp.]